MWRFILVTFAFLGWSFYVLSDGADYQPGAQSLQAHMKLAKTRPEARPEPVQTAAAAPETDEDVTRSVTTLTDLTVGGSDRVEVVLASVSADESALPDAEGGEVRTKAEILTEQEDTGAGDETALTVAEFVTASLSQRETLNVRWVSGDVVNMRDGPGTNYNRVAQLTKGTEVMILEAAEDGWVMLEVADTGEIGWMADWLLSEPN